MRFLSLLLTAAFALLPTQILAEPPAGKEGEVVLEDFAFASGERMAALKIHYTTLGKPHSGTDGAIDNAVMILHGTGGSGRNFFAPQFADELYGPGQPLDLAKYYVILPDGIGHGGSSKPSDGLKMAFPKYDYADMVEAQRRMLTEGLGVKRLELILGTSMGCMHAFVWGEAHPGFAKRLAPFACQPIPIAGINRSWRKLAIDAIMADPAWNQGNYTAEPAQGLRTAMSLMVIAGANPLAVQAQFPTREGAEAYVADAFAKTGAGRDANDLIYQLDASRTYDPSATLEKITVPVLWINSADDFINPPGYGITGPATRRMPRARFILIPGTIETKGHGTHTWAKFWKDDLAKLMAEVP